MFIINSLKVLFEYYIITRITRYHIIIVIRTVLNSFIVGKAESGTINIKRYFIIKKNFVYV